MLTNPETLFVLWCQLTGHESELYADEEREAFLARPQVDALTMTPRDVLTDAGTEAARRGSLPLERWLHAVRIVRPDHVGVTHRGTGHTEAECAEVGRPVLLGVA